MDKDEMIDKGLTKDNVLTIEGYVWDPPNEEQIKEAGGILELDDMSGWRSGHVLVKISDLERLGYVKAHCEACHNQGWLVVTKSPSGEVDVERCDLCRRFATDEEARAGLINHLYSNS